MKFSNIDSIVKRGLLEQNLPMHYYMEYLVHTTTCIRELAMDTLKIINTVELPVNEYGAVDLPDDFIDEVSVCMQAGTTLQKLPHQNWINPILKIDPDTGQYIPQSVEVNKTGVDSDFFWGSAGWLWYWNVNDFGEPTGRFFGATGGTSSGYSLLKERNQIQMSPDYSASSIILQYVSSGAYDTASLIDIQAIQCIRAWQEWKYSRNSNNDYSPEAISFYNRKKQLRSRLSGLSLVDVKNSLRQGYTGTIKN